MVVSRSLVAAVVTLLMMVSGVEALAGELIVLASTTSVENSGLLACICPNSPGKPASRCWF
jgi:ABC-type tungstate transport system permease subunit